MDDVKSHLDIDADALRTNLAEIRRWVGPDCALCTVLKADAYGLGATRLAPILEAAGSDLHATYTAGEALELLAAGARRPILVLMPQTELRPELEVVAGLRAGRLHATVHDAEQLLHLAGLGRAAGVPVPVHLELDTGMHRGGVPLGRERRLLERIARRPDVRLAGVFTHFVASSDDPEATAAQTACFRRALADARREGLLPEGALLHCANTGAMVRDRRTHFQAVRVGQGWVGYGPPPAEPGADAPRLRPALRWTTSIVHAKRIDAGAAVGYGSTWRATRPSLIGLVPVGYADGWPRALGTDPDRQMPVRVGVGRNGDGRPTAWAPVIGAVNMDQCMIDLTDVPFLAGTGAGAAPGRGLAIELIGPDPHAPTHLPTLARAAGTTHYELLCRLHPRIPRTVRDGADAESGRFLCTAGG